MHIKNIVGVTIQNLVVVDAMRYGILCDSASSLFSIQDSLIIGVKPFATGVGIIQAGIDAHTLDPSKLVIKNNIVNGVHGYGFVYQGYDCFINSAKAAWLSRISGNEAGSTRMGLAVYHGTSKCIGWSDFTAYKTQLGVGSFFKVSHTEADHMKFAENMMGYHTN